MHLRILIKVFDGRSMDSHRSSISSDGKYDSDQTADMQTGLNRRYVHMPTFTLFWILAYS